MLARITNILFKFRLLLANEYSKSALYSKHMGIKFGNNVRITDKPQFGSEAYLISIGNDVTISDGVIFHNHDGGVGVLRKKYPGIDVIKPISIGNNVFLGSRVTLMPGITIGNNVVVGAGSLVTKDIPDDVVVAGIPAKILKTLPEYEAKVLKEAVYLKDKNNESKKMAELLSIYKRKQQ